MNADDLFIFVPFLAAAIVIYSLISGSATLAPMTKPKSRKDDPIAYWIIIFIHVTVTVWASYVVIIQHF